MIVIRNVFRLKFGQAREAVALARQGLEIQKRVMTGLDHSARLLTDVTGPFYTLVMEEQYPSLSEMEREMQSEIGAEDWKGWYQKFVPLVDSGYREVFTLVE